MKHLRSILASTVILLSAVAASAQASDLSLQPFTYDPDGLCDVQAQWVSGGVGGATDSAIFLKKGMYHRDERRSRYRDHFVARRRQRQWAH